MKKNIAILGAGICGLSLAWFLKKRFQDTISITIFEAKERVGGWLQTIEKNGQLFECGPRSIRSINRELMELIGDLDLESEMIHASSAAKKRYIVYEGKPEPLPYSLKTLFSLPLGRKIVKAALWELFSRPSKLDDESVESFFNRHIGKQATKTFVSALTSGIYACDPAELSMLSCFPTLWEKDKLYGSLLLAKKKRGPRVYSFTFREGIETLPKKLASKIDATINLNTPIIRVEEDDAKVHVQTPENVLAFDHLFCTIAPHVIRQVVPAFSDLPVSQTSVATVSVAYKEELSLPEGFGFLCPTHEDPLLLGVVFDSCLFPEQNKMYKTRLSFMMGGSRAPQMLDFSDEVLLAYAQDFGKKYLGLQASIQEHHIVRAENAISCYPVGHYKVLGFLEEQKSRIQLLGSGFHGVAVGDSVAIAKRAANQF